MYLGNQPALNYTSFAKQDFSTSATTSYTLDNPVANANELALFINFVRQEPTTAYSASNTTLTLTSATASTDDMYCVYLGKAVQTVNPPSGSVGTSQLVDGAVTPIKQSALANPFASQLLHVRDEKTAATNGGTSVVGTQTRDLNTVVTNEITGASLSSNQITLPTGTYYIQASAPGYDCDRFRIQLYNVTDSSLEVLGNNTFADDAYNAATHCILNQRFTISAEKVFEIKQYMAVAKTANGLGLNDSAGSFSIYTDVQIWRTA